MGAGGLAVVLPCAFTPEVDGGPAGTQGIRCMTNTPVLVREGAMRVCHGNLRPGGGRATPGAAHEHRLRAPEVEET